MRIMVNIISLCFLIMVMCNIDITATDNVLGETRKEWLIKKITSLSQKTDIALREFFTLVKKEKQQFMGEFVQQTFFGIPHYYYAWGLVVGYGLQHSVSDNIKIMVSTGALVILMRQISNLSNRSAR